MAHLRLPLVPGVNDLPGDMEAAARFAASLGLKMNVHILPYHDSGRGKYALRATAYAMGDTTAPNPEAALEAAGIFERAGRQVMIGG